MELCWRPKQPWLLPIHSYSQPGHREGSWFILMGFGYFLGHLMGLWLQLSIVTSSGVWWYWCSPTSHLPDCASWLFLHVLCGFAIVFLPLPTSGIRSSIFFFCIYRGHHETIFIYRVPYFDDVGVFLFPTHLSW